MLPIEIYTHIISVTEQCDRVRIYNALFIPQFTRTLTPGRILDFMEVCGVDVHIEYYYGSNHKDCYIIWTMNSVIYRTDGPAISYTNGDKIWYKNGKPHRDFDKPAIIHANGNKFWYIDDIQYTPIH